MGDDVVVKVASVSKKFCRSLRRSLWYGVQDLGSELLGRNHYDELRRDEFWALKDVSFELKGGQCLGVIGPNGAGKTTLLRLLNGLIKPDRGRITMRGRVQALIDLGAGLNPILTGRENIYVNASVLGIPKREIDRRLYEIIDFAEIGDFIDAPLQSYSSGMRVRLGFSVSILLQPNIMLIDEVLAVGDLAFQNKCTRAIQRIKDSGAAFVFVSHNVGWVRNLSDYVAYLKNGEIEYLGEPTEAILRYLTDWPDHTSKFLHHKGTENYIRLQEVHFLDANGFPVDTVMSGGPLRIRLVFNARQHMQEPVFSVFFQPFGHQVTAACVNQQKNESRPSFSPGRHALDIDIQSFPLLPGKYMLKVSISSRSMLQKYGRVDNIGSIFVSPDPNQVEWTSRGGFVEIGSTWKTVQCRQS